MQIEPIDPEATCVVDQGGLRERRRISSQGASGLGLPRGFARRSSKSRLYFEGAPSYFGPSLGHSARLMGGIHSLSFALSVSHKVRSLCSLSKS
jgi:hypothetical protein